MNKIQLLQIVFAFFLVIVCWFFRWVYAQQKELDETLANDCVSSFEAHLELAPTLSANVELDRTLEYLKGPDCFPGLDFQIRTGRCDTAKDE